jgi:2-C-methyl-D-erythritol 4-phosphate cytidylyltransferase/2-C-methyl-D-erythritol 2,4-cyclodiphosphate synthase
VKQRASAIIVAAGNATRFGSPKVLTAIAGETAVERAVRPFLTSSVVEQVVLVTSADLIETLESRFTLADQLLVVEGGAERQQSVENGLRAIGECDVIVVHDAARPLVTEAIIERVVDAVASGADAAIPVLPVTDTLKRIDGDRLKTVDRAGLWRSQTPQAFRTERLKAALAWAAETSTSATDEAALIEAIGGTVVTVPGDERLMKLTHAEDAATVSLLAQEPRRTQTGIGYDVHRLVPGRHLVLGAVGFDHPLGLEGHSDADVLLHAIADAVLGAAALGDIGQHFPPSDPQWKGVDSLVILRHAGQLVGEIGGHIVSIDATVIAEAPKIGPHANEMRQRIGEALVLGADRVSIKATTNELMGFIGRGEGIAALAIATITLPGS